MLPVSFNPEPTATARPVHRRRWLRVKRRLAARSRASAESPVGRWTLLRSALTPEIDPDERAEQWCRLLLRRYGVMFRDLLANESAAPPWAALVRTYRRLEARGEIRGGRFVASVAGEQYALAEVIPFIRSATAEPDEKPVDVALSFKPHLRLERRGEDGQCETQSSPIIPVRFCAQAAGGGCRSSAAVRG